MIALYLLGGSLAGLVLLLIGWGAGYADALVDYRNGTLDREVGRR